MLESSRVVENYFVGCQWFTTAHMNVVYHAQRRTTLPPVLSPPFHPKRNLGCLPVQGGQRLRDALETNRAPGYHPRRAERGARSGRANPQRQRIPSPAQRRHQPFGGCRAHYDSLCSSSPSPNPRYPRASGGSRSSSSSRGESCRGQQRKYDSRGGGGSGWGIADEIVASK